MFESCRAHHLNLSHSVVPSGIAGSAQFALGTLRLAGREDEAFEVCVTNESPIAPLGTIAEGNSG
jgi:hypothetical protein